MYRTWHSRLIVATITGSSGAGAQKTKQSARLWRDGTRVENSRKNRVRRNIAAVISTVALAAGGVAVPNAPVAGAYVEKDQSSVSPNPDAKGDNNLGADVSVTATPDQNTVEPGAEFTVTVSGSIEAPFPGEGPGESPIRGSSVLLEFDGDQFEVVSLPSPASFQWGSGEIRDAQVGQDTGRIEFDFGDLGDGDTFEVQIPVRAKESAPEGAEFKSDVFGRARIFADQKFTRTEERWEAGNESCELVSVGRHKLNSGAYGVWLNSIWLGTRTE